MPCLFHHRWLQFLLVSMSLAALFRLKSTSPIMLPPTGSTSCSLKSIPANMNFCIELVCTPGEAGRGRNANNSRLDQRRAKRSATSITPPKSSARASSRSLFILRCKLHYYFLRLLYLPPDPLLTGTVTGPSARPHSHLLLRFPIDAAIFLAIFLSKTGREGAPARRTYLLNGNSLYGHPTPVLEEVGSTRFRRTRGCGAFFALGLFGLCF